MTQEPSDFRWDAKTEEAAQLISEGNLTFSEIAEKLGVGRSTVYRWTIRPEFAARIEELNEEFRKSTAHLFIARKAKRIAALNRRHLSMQRIIDERADDPDMADVPGGRTGLIVRDYKTVGSGESATIMPIYSVDTALLREMRETEKQAAQELGQWVDKQSIDLPTKAYDTESSPDTL